MQETWVQSLGWKIPWRRKWQPTPVFLPENPTDREDPSKKKKKLETHSQVLPDLLKSYPITESSTKNNLPLIFASTLTRQIDLY